MTKLAKLSNPAALGARCLSLALSLAACGSDAGRGDVKFTTWGEDYVEQGIPAAAFPKDGWSVKYSKFLVVFHAITVADSAGAVAAKLTTPRVFDLTKAGEKEITTFAGLEAKSWDRVSYQLGPMTSDAVLAPGIADADAQRMLAAKGHLHVEATVTKGSVTKTLHWTFAAPTLFVECEGEQGGKKTLGVTVTNGGTETVQLTLHGDHLFYDDLQATNAVPRFDAIAKADANADGEVTLDELAAVRLYAIDPGDGGYGTGAAANVNTLRDFVTALSRTVGHYRGEGECFAKSPLP
jgi:hypothetical protein